MFNDAYYDDDEDGGDGEEGDGERGEERRTKALDSLKAEREYRNKGPTHSSHSQKSTPLPSLTLSYTRSCRPAIT